MFINYTRCYFLAANIVKIFGNHLKFRFTPKRDFRELLLFFKGFPRLGLLAVILF